MSGWVLGLALVCAVLFAGQGGFLKTVLELPFWSVAARLTFATYLVHPMTIWLILGSRGGQPYHFSLVSIFSEFVGFSSVSAIAAVIFYFLVEGPFGELERWVFKGPAGRGNAMAAKGEKQVESGSSKMEDDKGRDDGGQELVAVVPVSEASEDEAVLAVRQ